MIPKFALEGYFEKLRFENNESITAQNSLKLWGILSKFFSYKTLASIHYKLLKMVPFSKKVGLIPFSGYKDIIIWDKEWFEETIDLPFEDITITCPKEYHKLLTKRYGDYNVFVRGTAVHSYIIVDTETPYREKLKEHYAEIKTRL